MYSGSVNALSSVGKPHWQTCNHVTTQRTAQMLTPCGAAVDAPGGGR